MGTLDYSIAQLVGDLMEICAQTKDERQILSRGRPLARRAALAKQSWLKPYMYEADSEQGFGVHLLHEQPDHTQAIFAVSWLPFFERTDDRTRPGHAELKKIGEKVFGVGELAAMPSGAIHLVWNETDKATLSLHIYGKHINFTGRSQFDLESQTETPFILKLA
jgi:predicted metal-dependent enzyme (double-stranded beta helix superfamily)